jgi:hypothetical protein
LFYKIQNAEDETDHDGVVVSITEIMIYDELVSEEWVISTGSIVQLKNNTGVTSYYLNVMPLNGL